MQEIFAEEISRVDPGFFLRMKESKYYPEDKRDIEGNCPELPYTLFVDKTFTDKDFHKKYPTIYHLRKMLMETEDTLDIRLVYLALHHMMKHRGHFLLSGDISQVMDYKMICCSRYASEMNRVNWKPVKEIIKKEIAHNPYLGYKELVTKDLSLDIEIELEYLIESEQLIRRKPNHKNPRYRWEARIK